MEADVKNGRGIAENVPGVGILDTWGDTVPADGAEGYATGCMFRHVNGGVGTSLYVNEGTLASADFNAK